MSEDREPDRPLPTETDQNLAENSAETPAESERKNPRARKSRLWLIAAVVFGLIFFGNSFFCALGPKPAGTLDAFPVANEIPSFPNRSPHTGFGAALGAESYVFGHGYSSFSFSAR